MRKLAIETLLVTVGLSVVICAQQTTVALAPMSDYVYDRMLSRAADPVSQQILIVAIDERSLRQIGRWPWRRSVHARLLRQLASAKPTAVVLDIGMTDSSEDDEELAAAMAKVPTFLPLLRTTNADHGEIHEPKFIGPPPMIASQSRGIGHAELVPDRDGVARMIYLAQGPPGKTEKYVGQLIAGSNFPFDNRSLVERGSWLYRAPLRIAFSAERGRYPTISYASVLKGEISPDQIRGRLVLVGVTAPSLGDEVLTPGTKTGRLLSGVEVHANAIDNLQHGRGIRTWPESWSRAWALFLLWLTACLLLRFRCFALPIALSLALGAVLVSAVVMSNRIWISPAMPVVCIFVLYMAWSWRSLHARFLTVRVGSPLREKLPAGPFAFAFRLIDGAGGAATSEFSKNALDRAAERLTQMQILIDREMSTMPVGLLICDEQGIIRVSNLAARALLLKAPPIGRENGPADSLDNVPLRELLDAMESTRPIRPTGDECESDSPSARWSGEYVTAERRTLQLRMAPVSEESEYGALGYVVTLVDLSDEREAERQREDWRRFLSHDLRSPQVNILSLLSLREEGVEVPMMFDAIRRESERTLLLAEGFMDMAEAESGRYQLNAVHLGALLTDVHEQVGGYAQRQAVTIDLLMADVEETVLQADGVLLRRAIVNLVDNAIRFSPANATVRICAAVDALSGAGGPGSHAVAICVSDDGVGMDDARREALLSGRHARETDGQRQPGCQHGVGWEIIRAVVRRHDGTIDGVSAPDAGCTFWIVLPVVGVRTFSSGST